MSDKIRIIDLFAGIGGIRLGFDQAFGKENCETVFVSEFDKNANKVYRDNFGEESPINGDITQISEKDIPPFDICLAGFPCQAFSMAGQRKGFDDDFKGMTRGTLFKDVVRICDYHKPKVIFCENVKNLEYHDHHKTFAIIKGAFEEIGYNVYHKVLASQDYGVPQTRERTYIVCIRKDIDPIKKGEDFPWPKPIITENNCIRKIMEKKPVSARYYLSTVYLECLKRHKARHEAAGHGFGYKIRDIDGLAGTIVCGGMGRERNLIVDKRQKDLTPVTNIKGEINKEGIRRLTPREMANLQGYPDDFKFDESNTLAYKQLGNTVTVPVIRAIAASLKDLFSVDDLAK